MSGASCGARTQSRLQHQRVPYLLHHGRCPAPQRELCMLCLPVRGRGHAEWVAPAAAAARSNAWQPAACAVLWAFLRTISRPRACRHHPAGGQGAAGASLAAVVQTQTGCPVAPALQLPWCCGHARETSSGRAATRCKCGARAALLVPTVMQRRSIKQLSGTRGCAQVCAQPSRAAPQSPPPRSPGRPPIGRSPSRRRELSAGPPIRPGCPGRCGTGLAAQLAHAPAPWVLGLGLGSFQWQRKRTGAPLACWVCCGGHVLGEWGRLLRCQDCGVVRRRARTVNARAHVLGT